MIKVFYKNPRLLVEYFSYFSVLKTKFSLDIWESKDKFKLMCGSKIAQKGRGRKEQESQMKMIKQALFKGFLDLKSDNAF